MHVREFFSCHIFPAHFVGFLFSYFFAVFFYFLYSFAKMKAYTVCATAQASIFTVFWPFSQRAVSEQLVKRIKTLEDKPRKLQGVDGRFLQTV